MPSHPASVTLPPTGPEASSPPRPGAPDAPPIALQDAPPVPHPDAPPVADPPAARPAAPRNAATASALVAVAVAALAALACAMIGPVVPIDLAVYLRAAQDVVAGRDPYVTPDGALPYLYPPLAAVLFVPLAALPGPVAAALMTAASVVALGRICLLASRAAGRPLTWPVVALAALSEPVFATLAFGQVNLVVVWLTLEGYLCRSGRRGGVLIGLAIALKLTPAIFLVPLLLRRRWDAVGALLAAVATGMSVGALAAPAASGRYWSGVFADGSRVGLGYLTNQSFTGAAWRLAGSGGAPAVTGVLCAATAFGLVTALLRHQADPLRDAVCTGLAGLLISPISWTHHWVWAIPLVLWTAGRGGRWRPLTLAWIVALASWPDWVGGAVALLCPPLGLILGNAYLLLGVTTLLALADGRVPEGPSRPATSPAGSLGWAGQPPIRESPCPTPPPSRPTPTTRPCPSSRASSPASRAPSAPSSPTSALR